MALTKPGASWRDRKLTPTELLEHGLASRDPAISSAWQAAKGLCPRTHLAPFSRGGQQGTPSQVPMCSGLVAFSPGASGGGSSKGRVMRRCSLHPPPPASLAVAPAPVDGPMAPHWPSDLVLACLLSLPEPGGSFWPLSLGCFTFCVAPVTGWNSLCPKFFRWVLISCSDS